MLHRHALLVQQPLLIFKLHLFLRESKIDRMSEGSQLLRSPCSHGNVEMTNNN